MLEFARVGGLACFAVEVGKQQGQMCRRCYRACMRWTSWHGTAVCDAQHTDTSLLLTVPTVEREPEEPPPFVVLVQGPPQVHPSFVSCGLMSRLVL